MKKIGLDYSKVFNFISNDELNQMKILVDEAAHKLHNKSGAGNDFLGWLDLPINYDKEEFSRIKKASDKIKSDSEVLVVIGIGGSYLGARILKEDEERAEMLKATTEQQVQKENEVKIAE